MDTPENNLPSVSPSQDIGYRAVEQFLFARPDSWIVNVLGGDNDFGIDAQIQLKTGTAAGKVCNLFHAQIKGGLTSFAEKDYVHVDLRVSTLNYFQRVTSIVLLIYVDLSETPPKSYFLPIHEEIIRLIGDELNFPRGDKKKRIKIKKENILNKEYDIAPKINEYTKEVIKLRASIYRQGGFNFSTKAKTENNFNFYVKEQEPVRKVSDEYFMRSEKRVRIDAFLPLYPNGTTSCLIIISLPGLNECMITLSRENLVKTLFQASFSPALLEGRSFIVGRPCSISPNYLLQIGNCRFFLPVDAMEEFCDIIDDLSNEYLARIRKIESLVGAESYPLSSSENLGYKVARIPRWLWARIQGFAEDFLYDEGESEWHVFDYDRYALRIVNKDASGKIVENAILWPERTESYSFHSPDKDVWLAWRPPHDRYNEVVVDNMWDIPTTEDFLTKKLIPKAYEYYETPEARSFWTDLFHKKNVTSKFTEDDIEQFGVVLGRTYWFKSNTSPAAKNLHQICSEMQSFFHCSSTNVYLTNEGRRDIYLGLALLLECCNGIELNYLRGNLNFITAQSPTQAAENLRERAASIDSGTTNYFEIDLVLRSYLHALKSDLNLTLLKSEEVLHYLAETIDVYQRASLIRKYSQSSH
ncbi:DUF4365 domain-containing protein [Chromobacterium haemolyticum]|uniref:DUF4365 domain-containing protein n=1 Tax=Chromobacterium haemolyticum TaxID=394935 RepID=UPI000DEFA61D|nr:DUF4365 domain-containing protein [Chromobacterium haemolyticum]